MALTATTATIEIRATEAFRAFFAQTTGLTSIDWRRHDDPRERPLPIAVVQVSNLRQEWAGADEFSGILTVMYESARNVDADADDITPEDSDMLANQTLHLAASAKISNAMANQSAMQTYMNAGASGRPCTDFHFYRCLEHDEPETTMGEDTWNTTFRRRVVLARVDYA